jgi:hypothetical protein
MNLVSIPVGIHLQLIDGWYDITDDLDAGSPFTLAREDGVGAFQFSSALYRRGTVPDANCEDLLELLHSFFRDKNLGEPVDVRIQPSYPTFVGGSSHNEGVVRVWYISDAKSFVLATYTSDSEAPSEVEQCEQMVRSIQFEE